MASELKDLTVVYAKQETLEPLKNLGRFLAFGIAGSICLGIGLVLWTLAALRALQTQTGSMFTDHLSWLPYLITMVASLLVIGLAIFAIGKDKRAADKRKEKKRAAAAAVEKVS